MDFSRDSYSNFPMDTFKNSFRDAILVIRKQSQNTLMASGRIPGGTSRGILEEGLEDFLQTSLMKFSEESLEKIL